MHEDSDAPAIVNGVGRIVVDGAQNVELRFELRSADFTASPAGQQPISATYRDLSTVAVDQGRVLLVIGDGQVRLIAEQLGAGLGSLVGELRERRARQMLSDRFVELPATERTELVEYRAGDEHGVAQLAYHAWGLALLPLDERLAWHLVRRADVEGVERDQSAGRVTLRRRPRPGAPDARPIDLLGLGAHAARTAERLSSVRDSALADAAAIVARLLPTTAPDLRAKAAALLIDGRPISRDQLGVAWEPVEHAVLSEPTFAASYSALVARAEGAEQAPRWIALAPRRPTDATEHVSWFLIGLAGNLLALELVSEGAHATYLFRIMPRAAYRGEPPGALGSALEEAVFDVSESLIDSRFLREPIYLPESALREPRYLRYHFAIAALPALRAARARFVGRLIHRTDESWARSLDEAIAWNAATGDDAAIWPGGAASAPDAESDGLEGA